MTQYEECPHCMGEGKVEVTSTRLTLGHGQRPTPHQAWHLKPPSAKQMGAIEGMADAREVDYDPPQFSWQASNLITMMRAIPPVSKPKLTPAAPPVPAFEDEPPAPAPKPQLQEMLEPLPKMMVDKITDGRYAITADDNTETIFLRKYTYKDDAKNRFAGCSLLQHRIAEEWHNHTVYWPSGKLTRISHSYKGMEFPEAWAQVFADPQDAAHRFAEREHRCCSCGTNLTDARSRHYGIGPECEKARPDVIGWVNTTVGPFVEGSEQD